MAIEFELSNASISAKSWAFLSARVGVPPPGGRLSGSMVGCVELFSSFSLVEFLGFFWLACLCCNEIDCWKKSMNEGGTPNNVSAAEMMGTRKSVSQEIWTQKSVSQTEKRDTKNCSFY